MWIKDGSQLRPGQLVYVWHDSGAFGPDQMYADVVRVNRKTATIKWLASGLLRRVEFHHLNLVTSEEDAQQIREEETPL